MHAENVLDPPVVNCCRLSRANDEATNLSKPSGPYARRGAVGYHPCNRYHRWLALYNDAVIYERLLSCSRTVLRTLFSICFQNTEPEGEILKM